MRILRRQTGGEQSHPATRHGRTSRLRLVRRQPDPRRMQFGVSMNKPWPGQHAPAAVHAHSTPSPAGAELGSWSRMSGHTVKVRIPLKNSVLQCKTVMLQCSKAPHNAALASPVIPRVAAGCLRKESTMWVSATPPQRPCF
jgi:hypothetical protein